LSLGGTGDGGIIRDVGSRAWSVEGSFGTLTAPGASRSKVGFGASGQLTVAQNGASSFTDVSIAGHTHAAGDIASGIMAVARLPAMAASGTGHAAGVVPDPGAAAGTAKVLHEDGTWGNVTEAQVTSLSGDLPKGLMTSKGDLVSWGSAPARLGASTTDGQVLMVDSTAPLGIRWSQGPGAVINTIAVGYVFLPGITIPQNGAAGTAVAGTANQLRVMQVVIRTRSRWARSSGILRLHLRAEHVRGVYDSSGNKLLEAALSCYDREWCERVIGSTVTLTPGTYWYAVSASDTTCAASGASLSADGFNMLGQEHNPNGDGCEFGIERGNAFHSRHPDV